MFCIYVYIYIYIYIYIYKHRALGLFAVLVVNLEALLNTNS